MKINPEHYFVLNGGKVIKDLNELVLVLGHIDKKTFEYHVNDSKNDFANWIRYVFKGPRLAENIEQLRFSELDMMIDYIRKYIDELFILVVNGGSSSLKFQLVEFSTKNAPIKGVIEAIGLDRCNISLTIHGENVTKDVNVKNHDEAVALMIRSILDNKIIGDISDIKAIGHRVVHGGEIYTEPTILNDEVLGKLNELSILAPLHNPANISCIKACMKVFHSPHVAVFDTAFHSTIPKEKFVYGLPYEFYEKHKIRKYGFHGSNHKYVSGLVNDMYKYENKKCPKLIVCHLGNGCSITAVRNGKSLNTTMGFTPLDGLLMGTRCGHMDPAVALHLENTLGMNREQLDKLFNKQSGLLGICGHSDMRDIHKTEHEDRSRLAMDMFADRVVHYIGAYIAEMNGVDAIVFTGGIGENAFYIRDIILDKFSYVGLKFDKKKNEKNEFIISAKDSAVNVFVIAANEELEIATETKKVLKL